ncbi:MAG: hypothetical protein K2X91_18790, partial [Thermoleophilia bacterium]|nr:hypothetical protein [Thermoleophilia bacterium]
MKAKAFLAKYPQRRAIAFYVGEAEVAMSFTAFTPLGPVEVGRRSMPREDGPLGPLFQKLRESIRSAKSWANASIGVAVPTLNVFYTTRPSQRGNQTQTPQELLHEVVQSASLNINKMDVDAIRRQVGKQTLASVAAIRKRALAPILEGLDAIEARPLQVEPAPCSLLRLALARHRTPGRPGTALRVFLGQTDALAILTSFDTPLTWRTFELEPGAEAGSVVSAYRYVANSYKIFGAESSPSVVMIHGRPDLHGIEEAPGWEGVRAKIIRRDGPGYDPGEIAAGLALGCHPRVESFHFARHIRPSEPLHRLVPWAQIGAQAAAAALGTVLLLNQHRSVVAAGADVARGLAAHTWVKAQTVPELRAERDDLLKRSKAVEEFLSTRILWTPCVRDVAARLPVSMTLMGVDGACEYGGEKGKGKGKRSMIVGVEAPIPEGAAVPPEVKALLDALRDSPVIHGTLPTIEMASLKWRSATEPGDAPTATFNVLCLPPA